MAPRKSIASSSEVNVTTASSRRTPSRKSKKIELSSSSDEEVSSTRTSSPPRTLMSSPRGPRSVAHPLPGATVSESGSSAAAGGVVPFHFWIFFAIILEHWVLDFGRPVANFYFRFLPYDRPNVGDWGHLLYNILTPFLLLQLLDKSSKKVGNNLKYLLVILMTIGASLHLVGDAIQSALIQRTDFDSSVKVRETSVMKSLNNENIVNQFEMTYFFDEHLGHFLWYMPYFSIFVLYFRACFSKMPAAPLGFLGYTFLLPTGSIFYWYLIVEGQVWPVFIVVIVVMALITLDAQSRGENLDANGLFLTWMFGAVTVLFVLWLIWLQVPFKNVYTIDLDGVPEFWETFPWLKDMLIHAKK